MRLLQKRTGQATVEAAVLIAAVVVAVMVMKGYVGRAAAGGMKSNADSMGGQFDSGAAWSSISVSHSSDASSNSSSCFEQGVGGGPAVVLDPAECAARAAAVPK